MTNNFERYARAGFGPHLIPILPPDAELHDGSERILPKRGKVPGKFTYLKKWVGFAEWVQHVTTDNCLNKWASWPGVGVGFRTGDFIAVDVDCSDADTSLALLDLAHNLLGPSPVRIGKAPKFLLLFRLAGAERIGKIRLPFGAGDAVEILGDGRQFVAEGVHPGAGKPYAWKQGHPCDSPPIAVTAAQVREFLAQAATLLGVGAPDISTGGSDASAIPQEDLKAPDAALAVQALESIPNDLDYDDWVRVSIALKAAGGEDAYESWVGWSLKYPGNNVELCEEKWASFKPPYQVGWPYLAERARKFGFNDASSVFTVLPMDVPPQGPSSTAESRRQERAQRAATAVALPEPDLPTLFEDWVYISNIKRFANLRTRDVLDKEQFNDLHSYVGALSGEKSASAIYLKNQTLRQWLPRLTYRPGAEVIVQEHDGRAFNTWVPSSLVLPQRGSVTEADVTTYLELLRHVFPDPRIQNLFLDWQAAVLQQPGRKINWAPLLKSDEHGLGKDLLCKPLIAGLGPHNVRTIDRDSLGSGFNAWAAGCKLIVVSEMQSFDRKETFNRLKPYLASPPDEIEVNAKHQAPYKVPNLFQLIFFTNLPDAMSFEARDRRVAVFESGARRREPEFYRDYVAWCDNGGAAALVAWLMTRDLSAFNWGGTAPDTDAKEDMRLASLPALESWLMEAMDDADAPFDQDVTTIEDLIASVPSNLVRGRLSRARLGAALKKEIGAVCAGRARIEKGRGGRRAWLWIIRNVATYRDWDVARIRDAYLKTHGGKLIDGGKVVNLFD